MANKTIDELVEATSIGASDLFVLKQTSGSRKLKGQVLLNWLTAAADGHGGISSIEKLSTSGLTDTYRITLADTTTFDFTVANGRGISGIAKSGTSGLTDTYKISYTDGTSGTFTVTNGAKGDTGENWYVHIKYASKEPTESSHSMGDTPDKWMGVYAGTLAAAPEDYTKYNWFCIKGDTGDPGAAAAVSSCTVQYQQSASGTVQPDSWQSTIPDVPQGSFLWTKVTIAFNSGSPAVFYTAARMGIDGSGAVSSVCDQSPDANGNVALTASNVGAIANTAGAVGTSNLASGAVTNAKIAAGAITDAKIASAVKSAAVTVSIAASAWSDGAATVSVTGVTASNHVIVSPAEASRESYAECGVRCTAQAAGKLTFKCDTAPTAALSVNVLCINL